MCYFVQAIDPKYRAGAVNWCVEVLKPLGIDCIAVRGASGVSMGSIVAHLLGVHLCVIRKPGESIHSNSKYEGVLGKKIAIIDDFVCSGRTLNAILKVTGGAEIILLYNGSFSGDTTSTYNDIPAISRGVMR